MEDHEKVYELTIQKLEKYKEISYIDSDNEFDEDYSSCDEKDTEKSM